MNIIKRNRLKLGLTQKELAKELKVHQVYVSDFETSKRMPSHKIIYKISIFFNLCPIYIYKSYYCAEFNSKNSKTKCSSCKINFTPAPNDLIFNARKNIKMTQKQLSKKLYVKQSYISEIENYKRFPAPNTIFKMSEILKICPVLIFQEYYCEISKEGPCKTCKAQVKSE